jgi:hypothetical protein
MEEENEETSKHGIAGRLVLIAVLLIVLGAIIPLIFPYMFVNKSPKIYVSNLLFMDGAIVMGVGALIAGGTAVYSGWGMIFADPEAYENYVRTQRKKQIVFGLMMIIIGAILAGLAVAIGSF